MSAQSIITDHLKALDKKDGSFAPFNAKEVSQTLGIEVGKVHSTVYNLTTRGFAEVERDGRNITGIRFTDKQPGQRGPAKPKTEGRPDPKPIASRTYSVPVRTPELDLYVQAKNAASALQRQYSDYVTVNFEEDALAEEAIALKAAALQKDETISELRAQLGAMREELAAAKADLETLRSTRNKKMVQEAAEAGALAVHSS